MPKAKKKAKKIKSKINHGQRMRDTPSPPVLEKTETVDLAMQTAAAQKTGMFVYNISKIGCSEKRNYERSNQNKR